MKLNRINLTQLLLLQNLQSFKTQSLLVKKIKSQNINTDFKYIYISTQKDTRCFFLQQQKYNLDSYIRCQRENQSFQFPSPPLKFEQVAIGFEHQCAVIDSILYCWLIDDNIFIPHNSLKTNTNGDPRTEQPMFFKNTGVSQIATGLQHSCATIKGWPLHQMECWGRNNQGQLDDTVEMGQRMEDRSNTTKFSNLQAGFWSSCVNANGELHCWGYIPYHALDQIPEEYKVESKYRRFNVSINLNNICVSSYYKKGLQKILTSCWGFCQFGVCDIEESHKTNTIRVSMGSKHVCAIDIKHLDQSISVHLWSGPVVCWGSDVFGELRVPKEFKSQVQQVESGNGFSCAMRNNFHMNCWGKFDQEQKEVSNFSRHISVGATHTCVNRNGKGYCSGNDWYGQTDLNIEGFMPTEIVIIEAGQDFTCISNLRQEINCFGFNARGQTDIPKLSNPSNSPTYLIMQVSLSLSHSCIIYDQQSRNLLCWGGLNNFDELTIPPTHSASIREVTTGDEHTCAALVIPDGEQIQDWTISCWGSNEQGQSEVPPVHVKMSLSEMSAGGAHTCALQMSALLECWGSDSHGQSKFNANTRLELVEQVSAGVVHTCVLNDGVKCQGLIDWFKGAKFEQDVSIVETGWEHDCLLDEIGMVQCRGSNEQNQCDIDGDQGR